MILPTKHIKLENSLLNVGATLLSNITNKQTVSLLWDSVRQYPEVKTFEKFTLTLDLLYTLGLVDLKNGIVVRIKNAALS